MESKDFAIWNVVPNYSIATGNPLPKDFPRLGVGISLIVTNIPSDNSLNEVINKLRETRYAELFVQTDTRGEFNSCGFREAWPREVRNDEASFRVESPGGVVTWGSLG